MDLGVVRDALPLLLKGLVVTVVLTLAGSGLALVLGQALAFFRLSGSRLLRAVSGAYVDFVRGTPLLIQLFALYFGAPQLGIDLSPLAAGILGLGLNGAAYVAEVLRAGILSVPKGQWEAASALGMGPLLALRRVILPQAYRIALPPLTGSLVALLKDTSLVSTITVVELTRQAQTLISSSYRAVELYLAAAALYFALTWPLLKLAERLERRLARGEAR